MSAAIGSPDSACGDVMAHEMESLILPRVVAQHAEDASFLWGQREQAAGAPHYDLQELATLDGRVEAHLDGLRIAGDAGWDQCREVAADEGAAGAFTLGVLAFESANRERVAGLLNQVDERPDVAAGLAAALSWIPLPRPSRYLEFLTAAESPAFRRIGLTAAIAHRELTDRAIQSALDDPDPVVQALGCRAAGEMGRRHLLAGVRSHGRSDDQDTRLIAGWSAALLGDRAPLGFLRAVAESTSKHAEMALQMATRASEPAAARAWLADLAALPKKRRLAIRAAGAAGLPDRVPWLIEFMSDPALARVAAESFTTITGADLDRDCSKGDAPEQFDAGPSDSPEDDNVTIDPDDNLPWPNRAAVEEWWAGHRQNFRPDVRYLMGSPLHPDSLHNILRYGRQRQRSAAALELALRAPATLFPVRAPAFRQLRSLGVAGL